MKTSAVVAIVAGLATSGCDTVSSHFRPNYAGPEAIMQRLAAAARQCGFSYVRTGPPLARFRPDDIGVRIEGLREGRRWDCLMRWSRDNGLDLSDYSIIYDQAPE